MRFDNRPADRQPHAHAVGFGRERRAEYPVHGAGFEALPGVFHGHHHTSGVMHFRPYG